VPRAALQLLPGRGESVGAALVADARVRGVMFTGSTEVATLINRQLAARGGDVPLIAETGGQNAMIVDATALPEQVVADVLASSFDSAGQRCSALRVLCLQADVADGMLEMLCGAARELRIGNPADMRCDVGPVIDADARERLEAHVAAMQAAGFPLTRLPLPDACGRGTYVAPTIIEIDHLGRLGAEQFGPVLHVLRYRAAELDTLIDAINASGYGLTMGLHSRIDETIARVSSRARVGNLYVNRNMIGAVVGVQPFGGEGLSGTGPKAGGPLYLLRLLSRSPGTGPGAPRSEGSQAALDTLADWLTTSAAALLPADAISTLHAHLQTYRQRTLCGLRLALPGPTGEDNSLRFVPRGRIAGIASGMAAQLHQLAAALASGNRLLVQDGDDLRRLVSSLPATLGATFEPVADCAASDCGALLFDGPDAAADALRIRLAARNGPIVGLLRPTPHYDLARLLHERTLSINSAAAGGNASLLALGG
jgi:RHH-type transcriptional regulator, proline utilization regulon repressor / proline dehydrogenase / delta 1-pyrroline-5-carboxylate dehydrogenase